MDKSTRDPCHLIAIKPYGDLELGFSPAHWYKINFILIQLQTWGSTHTFSVAVREVSLSSSPERLSQPQPAFSLASEPSPPGFL